MLTFSYHLQVAQDRGIERRLVQLDFSAAFDRMSHRGLLYKLKTIDVEGKFLFIVSEFFSDRKQRVRLDGKVSASVNIISGVPQGSDLEPLLFL